MSALASAAVVVLSAASAAAATRVVVVQSELEPASAAERQAVQQLIGELAADGYEVVVTKVADKDERVLIRSSPNADGLAVTVATRGARADAVETTSVRVHGDDTVAARDLALKTVEWLRGRGFEPHSAPPDEQAPATVQAGLSLALLVHPGGFPTAVAPGVSFRYRVGNIRLLAQGLFSSRESLRAPGGTAALEQTLLLGGISLAPPLEGGWAPFMSAVAGAYRLQGEGRAVPGLESKRAGSWAFAAGIGAGARIEAFANRSVGLELYAGMDALWVVPQPVVRFVEQSVASGGQPLFVLASGLEMTFR